MRVSLQKIRRAAAHRARTLVVTDSFEVLVVATVSAGKSSFINALIGRELLHAANEATTACVTRIEHRKERRAFAGASYRQSGTVLARDRNATPELVRDWNADSRVARIALEGRFDSAPRLASGLVVYDTPGPNNSQNERHREAAQHALRSIPFNAMFYVMNAGQLGTQDDRACLDLLHTRANTAPVYFLLNKVDLLDPEKGEHVAVHVRNAQRYLLNAGFDNPIVVPTVTDAALYARKALNGHALTRAQRAKLKSALDEFNIGGRQIVDAAIVPDAIRSTVSRELDLLERLIARPPEDPHAVERFALKQLVARSGIRTTEAIIQHQRSLICTK